MKYPWEKKESKEGDEHIEIRLPEAEQKKLDESLEASKKADAKIDAMMEGFNSIKAYVDSEKAEKERIKAEAAARKAQDNQQTVDEEIESLMLTDPKAAIKKATEGQSLAIMVLRADQLKKDTFDDAEKYPYYAGDVKAEVDKLLAGQSLAARNDIGVIENTYYTVLGRRSKDMEEKKLKTRFASPESRRGTGDGNNVDSDNGAPVITDEIRKIAKMFDMKPEEYAKALQEEGIV